MNTYSSQLLVFFYKSSLDNRDFLLVKAGKARWAPDSARSSSILSPLPAMNLAPCNSSHHQSPCSLFLFAVFCRHLAASFILSCLHVSQPHSLRLLLASLSLVLLCLSYIVVKQRTGADCTDLNVEQFSSLAYHAYRLLGLFSARFLNENTEGT